MIYWTQPINIKWNFNQLTWLFCTDSCEEPKTVYSASSISIVSIFQNLLEGYGIRCWVKNEFSSAGIGEIPPIECWPQLCVDDDDYEEAKRIVDEALSDKDMPVWKCDSCSEVIEGQFTECWNCGKSRSL